MKYISVSQYAEKFGISERTARNYCANGKIEGAFLTGKTWNIPEEASLPRRSKASSHVLPLLQVLRDQKASKMKGLSRTSSTSMCALSRYILFKMETDESVGC